MIAAAASRLTATNRFLHRHGRFVLVLLLTLASGGCNDARVPTSRPSTATPAAKQTVYLHINGFQKSKSGAT